MRRHPLMHNLVDFFTAQNKTPVTALSSWLWRSNLHLGAGVEKV